MKRMEQIDKTTRAVNFTTLVLGYLLQALYADLQRSDLQGNPIYSAAICSVRYRTSLPCAS